MVLPVNMVKCLVNSINWFNVCKWSVIYQWRTKIHTFPKIYTFHGLLMTVLLIFLKDCLVTEVLRGMCKGGLIFINFSTQTTW